MLGEIKWAGVNLSTLGDVIIEKIPNTNRPEPKFDRFEVPGRNGDIIIPQDAFYNVDRTYDLVVHGDYNEASSALMTWLYSTTGYSELSDSFDPDVYRKAYVAYETNIENLRNTDGRCSITFNCDPRRYLISGRDITVTHGDEIVNPTKYVSYPRIVLNGIATRTSFTIAIGNYSLYLEDIGYAGGIIIDCESRNVWRAGELLNDKATGVFPVIEPGAQTVAILGGFTSARIDTRWWTI